MGAKCWAAYKVCGGTKQYVCGVDSRGAIAFSSVLEKAWLFDDNMARLYRSCGYEIEKIGE